MRIFSKLETQHDDLIHDISYDFYGKRMATCSSDQKIKVWDQNEKGEWTLTSEWKAHSGSIWKVAWAHPEFGQIIASCSFDRTVCIWEEEEGWFHELGPIVHDITGIIPCVCIATKHCVFTTMFLIRISTDSKGAKSWAKRATLVDSRDSVQDIKFGPRHLGLKIATCSTDGFVRIYEAIDITNLSHWSMMEEFEAQKGGVTCLSWNPSALDPRPMLAVASNEPDVKIWEYNETYRKWFHVETLKGHKMAVHDVSWAPSVGRSYHLVATASKDETVKIWRLKSLVDKQKIEVKEVASFDDHHAEVWRVEWNITGTVLASSGDDGTVRLWKTNFQNEWKCMSVIRGDEEEV